MIRGFPSYAAKDEMGIWERLIEKSLSAVIGSSTIRVNHHNQLDELVVEATR